MQAKKYRRNLKMTRLEVTISPILQEKIWEEIRSHESKGRIFTKSDIIREELENRYFKKTAAEQQ
jgi:hypothetical protein